MRYCGETINKPFHSPTNRGMLRASRRGGRHSGCVSRCRRSSNRGGCGRGGAGGQGLIHYPCVFPHKSSSAVQTHRSMTNIIFVIISFNLITDEQFLSNI